MKEKFVFQWHITSKCNLRCKHCYIDNYDKDLELEDLLKIFTQIKLFLKENNFKGHINFTGGEPFISLYIWELLKLCEINKISFGILTNGTLLDEQIINKLKSFKYLKFIQVSLDGIEKTHDFIRGKGSFSKTIKNLSLVKQNGIQTMVSFTASKQNFKELKHLIRICEKNDVDRFWTDRLIPMGSNELDIMSNEECLEYLNILGKEVKRSIFLRKKNISKMIVHSNRALQFLCVDNGDGVYSCSAGKRLLTILEDGTLLPCRRLPISLGNLKNENIINIFKNNETIKELNCENVIEDCNKCFYKKTCNGGAKCLTYSLTGKLNRKDINCPF